MGTTVGAEQPEQWSRELEQKVRAALREMRFGTVTLVIQDGRIVQIDRNEKIRVR